ncbi:MAG: TlpA disulfide reductase family protein [Candidatus Thiodiazotropha sp. L084R]
MWNKILIVCAMLLLPAVLFAGDVDSKRDRADQQTNGAFSLEQYRDKVVLIDFWASWCGPCRETFPWLNKMQQKYQALGFEVVGINIDEDRSQAELFLSKVPADFTIAYDPEGKLAKEYDLQGMPASYLIDREGRVIKSHVGFFESETEMRESEIKQALKQ